MASELRELIDRKETETEEQPKAKATRRKKTKLEEESQTDTVTAEDVPEQTPPIPVTLNEVRATLAEKSRAGHTAEVKELITKYGAEKLSDVDPANYVALLKESEVIGNA